MLGSRGAAVLGGVLGLAGCGPEVDTPPFDVAGVYTERVYWHDGEFYGEPSSIELFADGTFQWRRGGCPSPGVDTHGTWERQGRTVSMYPIDLSERFGTLELSGGAMWSARVRSYDVTPRPNLRGGALLPDRCARQWAHRMDVRGGEPCDEIAEVCAAVFDAEAATD